MDFTNMDFTNKVVIVTGGASGIGIETARALAGTGAEVTLAVRNVEAVQSAGLIWLFPLIFASSAFVPTAGTPAEPLQN